MGLRLEFARSAPQRNPTDYFKRGIGGLVDDGSFDISSPNGWLPAIVASSRGGVENRARQESIVWQRLLLAATGDGSGGGTLGLANLKAKSGVGSAFSRFAPTAGKSSASTCHGRRPGVATRLSTNLTNPPQL